MKLLIIAVSALLLAVIALAFALYFKNIEINRLESHLSELWKAQNPWNRRFETFYRFVIVSEDLTEYMKRESEKLEAEGYKYDKDRSFPTVLCFSKRIEIKDDPTEETLNQTF